MSKKYQKIVVLAGGTSAEREVSLVSGKGSYEALLRLGYDSHLVDPASPDWPFNLIDLKPDAVLNMLHGQYGEDGTVQGLLETLKLPYSHSGVTCSAITMNKIATKTMLSAYGLPCTDSLDGTFEEIKQDGSDFPFPAVLKPVSEGSSVGIYMVNSYEDLLKLEPIAVKNNHYMLERFIKGRELTVGVMAGKALAVTEIMPRNHFYDYDSKYADKGSVHQVPANIPQDVYEAMMDYAEQAHHILGCEGVSRTDFRYDETDSCAIIILEVNNQPGMTPTSLVPEQAAYQGISYDELVSYLTENASWNK